MTKLPNPADRVVYSVCSIPSREAVFEKTVKSVVDQCDELHVYLDNYTHVPAFLRRLGSRCTVVMASERPGLRDNGKFIQLENLLRDRRSAYYFTIDDDIGYPVDYTNAMLSRLEQFERRCVVGVHGVLLKDRPAGYFSDRRIVYNFMKPLEVDKVVNVIGTGTLAFHTSVFERFDLSSFEETGMADLFFAVACKAASIPMIAVSRHEGWLVDLNPNPGISLYHEFKGRDDKHKRIVSDHGPWGIESIQRALDVLRPTSARTVELLDRIKPPLASLTR